MRTRTRKVTPPPKTLSMKDRAALHEFAQGYLRWVQAVAKLDDTDLEQLVIACENVSPTNCGWEVYRAAKTIMPEVLAELGQRTREASVPTPHAYGTGQTNPESREAAAGDETPDTPSVG